MKYPGFKAMTPEQRKQYGSIGGSKPKTLNPTRYKKSDRTRQFSMQVRSGERIEFNGELVESVDYQLADL